MTCNVLSMCGQQDTDVLCANAAALALHLSDIPWHGPVATLRVSLTRDERVCARALTCGCTLGLQLLLNTSHADPTTIACNVLMSVTANKQIAMVEVGGRATPNNVLMKCIDYGARARVRCHILQFTFAGLEQSQHIIDAMNAMRASVGRNKRSVRSICLHALEICAVPNNGSARCIGRCAFSR